MFLWVGHILSKNIIKAFEGQVIYPVFEHIETFVVVVMAAVEHFDWNAPYHRLYQQQLLHQMHLVVIVKLAMVPPKVKISLS